MPWREADSDAMTAQNAPWLSIVGIGEDGLGGSPAVYRVIGGRGGGAPRPAAMLALPVGFVGAAEWKQALGAADRGVPYRTLHGRRGGSAMAAAAVNGLARSGL